MSEVEELKGKESIKAEDQQYDYIIVGAGSAGCVIARRLLDETDAKILLLEAGELQEKADVIDNPLRWIENIGSGHDYLYPYQPSELLNNRAIYAPRGKLVGGSGSINAMIWARGHEDDYNSWADAGNNGWDFESVLPLFKKIEDWFAGASDFHGTGGPLHISQPKELHRIDVASTAAAISYGIPFKPDMNSRAPGSVSPTSTTVKDGIRCSAFSGYLKPVLTHKNLTLSTGATVTKLNFEGNQCTGLNYIKNGDTFRATAAKEVILSAGAFESPRILMLSGIGKKEDLQDLGIQCLVDLPGVGQNLQDHPLLQLTFQAKQPIGKLTNNLGGTIIYWKSNEDKIKSDVMLIPIEVPVQSSEITATHPIPEYSFGIFVGLVGVKSKGYVKMKTMAYDGPLEIQPNLVKDPEDLEALAGAIELGMALAQEPALAEQIAQWVAPAKPLSREEVLSYIKDACGTYFHPAGTCAMGDGSESVVNEKLSVYGVRGLRVADASVMPQIPTANTNAPTLMIAEFMAEVLLGKR
ncbi:GMC family oxidoreductase [Mucilaginibacter lappiensis]|uniref:GMC family oxidoreductase n=1 Tax=Mucilaginibacter lappiensis TaxID=354630 RepID=UPI003D251AF3